jgi:hypothetical protein
MKNIIILSAFLLTLPNLSLGENVKGKVVNESRGGSPVRDLELTLHQIDGSYTQKFKTDRRGMFNLKGFGGDPEGTYHLLARFEGIDYISEHFNMKEDNNLQMSVYDSTRSAGAIETEAHHLIVEVDNGELNVTEILIVNNKGEKAYTGLIEIPFPEDAVSSELVEGIQSVEMEGKIFDDRGIIPGARELVFRYHLKIQTKNMKLAVPLQFPTTIISFLISDPTLSVKSSMLSPPDIQMIGDRQYLSVIGRDFSKGSVVEVEIEGFHKDWNTSVLIFFGGIILLFTLGIGIPILRRNRIHSTGTMDAGSISQNELYERKDFLINVLAELDERFESGKISRGFHKEMKDFHRDNLKEVLEEIGKKET